MDVILDLVKAFAVGGLICVLAQILIDLTKLTPAKILVSFVVLGVILGGVGVYEYIYDFAGSGASIPIIGFGYNLAKGTKDAIIENGWLGIISGPLSSSSVGIMSAIIMGLIVSVIFKPKMKD